VADPCRVCDRDDCPTIGMTAPHVEGVHRSKCPPCAAVDDCAAHRVDWRARVLALTAAGQRMHDLIEAYGWDADEPREALAGWLKARGLSPLPSSTYSGVMVRAAADVFDGLEDDGG